MASRLGEHWNGGRSMTLLTDSQTELLSDVTTANKTYRESKENAPQRNKQLAEQEIAAHLASLDSRVRVALDAGVPASRIHNEGMRSTAKKSLVDSLARSADRDSSSPIPIVDKVALLDEVARAWGAYLGADGAVIEVARRMDELDFQASNELLELSIPLCETENRLHMILVMHCLNALRAGIDWPTLHARSLSTLPLECLEGLKRKVVLCSEILNDWHEDRCPGPAGALGGSV